MLNLILLIFCQESKSGGANGSIRFRYFCFIFQAKYYVLWDKLEFSCGFMLYSSELDRPENKGLATAIQFLETLKKDIDADAKGGPITWADLFQLSG